jgi:hypothetical protein
MHVPPPKPATNAFEQKLSDPPSCVNVQHLSLPDSVQSAFIAQSRTVCVPEHVVPSIVVQLALALHATTGGSVVQLGTVPPVMVIVPQQTGVAPLQPAGDVHADAPLSPDEESDVAAPSPDPPPSVPPPPS